MYICQKRKYKYMSISNDLKDVLNLSLGLLGEDSITDYDTPDTEAAIKMKRYMDFSIVEVQRDYLWQELVTQSALLSSDEEYEYVMPDDCLRPLDVVGGDSLEIHPYFEDFNYKYELVGNVIKTYASDPELIYIKSELDPTQWSSEMEHCIALKLAINAGYLVTDNSAHIQRLEQKYEGLSLPKAKQLQSKKKTNATRFLKDNFINRRVRS